MNTLGNIKPPGNSSKKNQQAVNPFARALAESEKGTYAGGKQQLDTSSDLFSEALAKTGGQISKNISPQELKKQEDTLKKEQKRAELHRKLHDQINPVDQAEVFSGYKERTKKELNEVRKELKKLALEISKFYKEVDIQTTQEITDQGVEGLGLKSFFKNLKAWIILLTQQVRSARTWMRQQQARANKIKSRKIKGGLMMNEGGNAESKVVFDMMHHERSTAYSGG
ncbi:hypothetical protein KJ707_01355 [Patescibacteria group bacterium]|nr:hypothetical protein [Patescibacteria group bacterium]MBU2543199.1 hypothetical protein [Patescibacteria group bacterium]